jgi:twitching motility protein PilI
LSLAALIERPFELLLELERRAKAAVAAREGAKTSTEEWVGIAFRLGDEKLVTTRADVREVLPVPEQLTRIPGAKPWLQGVANVRGQLLTVVDLKSFLGAGRTQPDRHSRMLLAASRDVPTALVVDEVLGIKRFTDDEYDEESPATVMRCETYLDGMFRRGGETWPRFNLLELIGDEHFLNAGAPAKV